MSTATTVYACIALSNAQSMERVVELVNGGTVEGVQGIEFTSEQLAGQYAFEAAKEAGYGNSDADHEGQLEFLIEAGAVFNTAAAVKHAAALVAADE